MTVKNKYIRRAKISEAKSRQMLRLFAHDLDAQLIADLVNLNRNTINRYLQLIRMRLSEMCRQDLSICQESAFSPPHVDDEAILSNGRFKSNKNHMFGIIKDGHYVSAQLVPEAIKPALQGVIRGNAAPEVTQRLTRYCNCHSIVDVGYNKQIRIGSLMRTGNGSGGIDIIEAFWSFAKHRLAKFYGIAESTFFLHLKECEFRFNHRNENLYNLLLQIFRTRPLS
jgi:hypothetical protein